MHIYFREIKEDSDFPIDQQKNLRQQFTLLEANNGIHW